MITQRKVITLLRKELPYLKNKYNVQRLGLFGSFAKGIQQRKSDIDIFVEFQKPIGLDFIEFAEHLENVLGSKIDTLTPEGIKGIRIKGVENSVKRGIIYV